MLIDGISTISASNCSKRGRVAVIYDSNDASDRGIEWSFQRRGIMLRSIKSGAAACWTLDNLAPRILKRNFEPGFFVDHFVKDMSIALEEARRMNLTLPGLTLVHQLYRSIQAQGHGRCGTQALMLALEELSHVTVDATSPRAAEI